LEEAIKGSYLTQGLSEEELQALYDIAECRTYEDGEVILKQFDDTRDLYVLCDGKGHVVTIVGDPIGVVKPGMPLGEVSFIDHRTRSVSVVSVGPSEVVVLPFEKTWEILSQRPSMELTLLRNISRVLCSRLRSANNNIAALMAIEESDHRAA